MKEKYITARNTHNGLPEVLYTYAVDKGFKYPFDAFCMVLLDIDFEMLISYMDQLFGLTILVDKNGNFIKVVE
jgi:hypothetical protein